MLEEVIFEFSPNSDLNEKYTVHFLIKNTVEKILNPDISLNEAITLVPFLVDKSRDNNLPIDDNYDIRLDYKYGSLTCNSLINYVISLIIETNSDIKNKFLENENYKYNLKQINTGIVIN